MTTLSYFINIIISTFIMLVMIRNPLEYHVGKTRYSSLLHLSIFIAPALIAAFLINVPKFLETELVWIEREEVGRRVSANQNLILF